MSKAPTLVLRPARKRDVSLLTSLSWLPTASRRPRKNVLRLNGLFGWPAGRNCGEGLRPPVLGLNVEPVPKPTACAKPGKKVEPETKLISP